MLSAMQKSKRRQLGLTAACAMATLALIAPSAATAGRDLYVSNSGTSNVSAFDIDGEGSLSPLGGSPFAGATSAEGTTISPDGRHLYSPSFIAGTVAAYDIAGDGALTPVTGSPFPAPGIHFTAAITPNGKHLYIPDYNGNLDALNIAADGSLTVVPGSPYSTPSGPFGVAVTPDSNRLYMSDTTGSRIYAFDIGAGGSLSAIGGSPFTFPGTGPRALGITPDGAHLYATDTTNKKVQAYSIAADGSLAAFPSPPSTGEGPANLSITPDGTHLYVGNTATNNVSAFNIAPGGSLSAVPGSPFAAGTTTEGLTSSPDSKKLYVASFGDSDVNAFDIAAGGSLSPIPGSPFSTGGTSPAVQSVSITPDQAPTAALAVGTSSRTATFNAGASSDPDGSVARYDWSFGDGTTLSSGGPTPFHTYAADGAYTVTVTVADGEACSTRLLFTGQIAACNGNAGATASRQVVIDTAVANPRLTARKTQRHKGRRVKVAVKASAGEKATVTLGGKVSIAAKGKAKKSYKLRNVIVHLPAGAPKSATLAPKGKKATNAILSALAAKLRVNAIISAKFADEAGNIAAKKVSVKLR
jgi:6-phosphogluconolactonase (cycloisomerase 2 family)